MTNVISSKHLFGTASRIFLNLDLGCSSACSYCYLPQEGFSIGRRQIDRRAITVDTLVDRLIESTFFVKGPLGSVLSIGCYSEAWDPNNRASTLDLLQTLLPFGNPIQVATKRRVTVGQIEDLVRDRQWGNQLSIFISTATIRDWRDYEIRTESPKRRFSSFAIAQSCALPMFLYIKPVIPGVTIESLQEYVGIVKKYNVPVVVGDRFEADENDTPSQISKKLFLVETNEAELMREAFRMNADVYSSSIDAVEKLRSQR